MSHNSFEFDFRRGNSLIAKHSPTVRSLQLHYGAFLCWMLGVCQSGILVWMPKVDVNWKSHRIVFEKKLRAAWKRAATQLHTNPGIRFGAVGAAGMHRRRCISVERNGENSCGNAIQKAKHEWNECRISQQALLWAIHHSVFRGMTAVSYQPFGSTQMRHVCRAMASGYELNAIQSIHSLRLECIRKQSWFSMT